MEDNKTPKVEDTTPTVAADQPTTSVDNSATTDKPIVAVQQTTTSIDGSAPVKSIEHAADNGGTNEQKPKSFFTKKKLILFGVFVLLSIGFMFITIFPILKVDWHELNVSIGIGIAQNWGWLWLFLLILQIFINLNRGFFTMIPRLKKWGYNISYKDYLVFSITGSFICAVSPANLLSDPYTIFWLRTQGVPTSKAVSMFFTNSLLWQVAQIIITMPFFVICCMFKYRLDGNPADKFLFAMICIGVIIDFVGLIFIFLMNWSKSFHYFISRIFNWFKKKFHMKYHTKEETIQKYKEKAVLKQSFYESMRDWKTTGYILFFWILGDMLGLLAIVWCLCFVQNMLVYATENQPTIVHASFDIGWSLVCARLSVPANRLNILPGQAMGYEASLVRLLTVFSSWNITTSPYWKLTEDQLNWVRENVVHNSVLTGKVFLAWVPAIAGIPAFIVLTKNQIKLSNQGKLMNK